jgi:hypothetical protein
MSHLFIKQQNQELLWRIINQTPQMQLYFQGAQQGAREAWFQQIVQHVYTKSVGINVSIKDLNKEAIQLMLDLLQKAEQTQYVKQQQQQQQQQQQLRPVYTNDLYESRLKEYETEKKIPEQPLQLTPFKDDAIQDIGSAVSDYIKSRNTDIAFPPPPTGSIPKKSVSWEDDNPLLIKILNKLSVLEEKIDNLQKELKNKNNQNNAEPV